MRRPADISPAWTAERMGDRAESCIIFLAVHGLLSGGEKRRVRARLQAAIDKWNTSNPAQAPRGASR